MTTRRDLLLAVLVLSVIAVIWSVLLNPRGERLSVADLAGLVPTVISLVGMDREAKKPRAKEEHELTPFRLSPSFSSGLYGGLLGGVAAGLVIGVMYYTASQSAGWQIVLHIFMYASCAGTLLGAASQLLILWFRHLAAHGPYPAVAFNEVSGGVLGGVIAWLPVGAMGGWFFGLRPLPFVDLGLLVTGAGLGAISIVFGALLYDYAGRWQKVVRALSVAMVISVFVIVLGSMAMPFLDVERFFPWGATVLQVAEGGAIMGGALGGLLGLQIGLTLFLYRQWEAMARPLGPESSQGGSV